MLLGAHENVLQKLPSPLLKNFYPIAIFVTLVVVMISVINYNNGNDAPSFLAFVQGKTVILIIHVNHIKFLVANTVALTT